MNQPDFLEVGRQLRKPEGDFGKIIGNNMNTGNADMHTLAFELLTFKIGDSVLEIGFGNGKYFPELLKLNPEISLTGLDYSQTMCDEAAANNAELLQSGKLKLLCGDAAQMPFEAESFDVILTLNTLYFWRDADAQIEELKRVLKPNGKMLIGFRPKHIVEALPFTKEGFTTYTQEDVRRLLETHGFAVLKEELRESMTKGFDGGDFETACACILAEKK
ncbi:MAG TPA: class I SAM-dependent methyltransferase [Patescibacteria group bacterium]|nr:class I SAM-dependent methyltransferase [Patescibacteria group bacterium]